MVDNATLPIFGSGGDYDLEEKEVGGIGRAGDRGEDGSEGVGVLEIAISLERITIAATQC